MNIRAVLLDAGGTLIHANPSLEGVYAAVSREFGADIQPEDLRLHLRMTIKDYRLRARTGRAPNLPISEEEDRNMWKGIARQVQTSIPALKNVDFDAWFDRLYATLCDPKAWAVYPDAREFVETLAQHGYLLGVVSNWNPNLTRILAEHGIARHFKAIVVSSLAGVQKPDPQIFVQGLEQLGVNPNETIYIGNNYDDDVAGATAAGMRAALLARNGQGGQQAISDLRQLLPHLVQS